MSDENQPGPPPLIGAGSVPENQENENVTENSEDEAKKASEAQRASEERQEALDEALKNQPDQRTEPFGESTVGFSVGVPDDEDREDKDEPKTAFNSPKEETPVPDVNDSLSNWGSPLHAVNDPFETEAGSPFDKGGFVGVDPYRAVVQEGVRDPGDESATGDDEGDEG